MPFDLDAAIKLLTMATLTGLLFATGLRLSWAQVIVSLRCSHLEWMLPVNFLFVPLLTLAVVLGLGIPAHIAAGMGLLAAAPFAPVVPTFTKMARGDVALAGGLTALFPFFSAFLTPLICQWSLRPMLGAEFFEFRPFAILGTLTATITLPLVAGITFRHFMPTVGRWLLKPSEALSETAGAISLTFVTVAEFHTIRAVGWKALLGMVLVSELSLLAGYILSGPSPKVRRVMALGTSNRNIALALLMALQSFSGTPIVAAVATNGLVLIFLGLVHVGFWRYLSREAVG